MERDPRLVVLEGWLSPCTTEMYLVCNTGLLLTVTALCSRFFVPTFSDRPFARCRTLKFLTIRENMTMRSERWAPILSSTLVEAARSSLYAIADDVAALDTRTQQPATLSDFALLFGYLSQVEQSEKWQQLTIEYLERSIEKVSTTHAGWLGLYGGMCGVGWSVEHLARLLDENSEASDAGSSDDPIEAIDTYLNNSLESGNWQGPYDLISGLVGFGAYFLERLPRQSARRGIELVLRKLEERHEKSWGGSDVAHSAAVHTLSAAYLRSRRILQSRSCAWCARGY